MALLGNLSSMGKEKRTWQSADIMSYFLIDVETYIIGGLQNDVCYTEELTFHTHDIDEIPRLYTCKVVIVIMIYPALTL